jgi:hypothetical protein
MSAGEDIAAPPEADSFEALLDSTCSRLWDRKLRHSLRRIEELAGILDRADQELESLSHRGETGDGPAGDGPATGPVNKGLTVFTPPAGVPSAERAGSGAP